MTAEYCGLVGVTNKNINRHLPVRTLGACLEFPFFKFAG